MSDKPKTFAQNRLQKLQAALKESKTNTKNASAEQSLRGCQQLSGGINKVTSRKTNIISKAPIFPSKESRKNVMSASLKQLINPGSALNLKTAVDKNGTFQTLNTSSRVEAAPQKVVYYGTDYPSSGVSSTAGRERPEERQLSHKVTPHHAGDGPAQQRLKKIKQAFLDEVQQQNETPQRSQGKRKSDHKNMEETKVIKKNKTEDSSKSPVLQSAIKHQKPKEKSTSSFRAKLSPLSDSYFDDDISLPEGPKKKTLFTSPVPKRHTFKVPVSSNLSQKKIMKTPPLPSKTVNSSLEDKIDDIENIQEPSVLPSFKTKLQARMQRVLNDAKKKIKKIGQGFLSTSSNSKATESTLTENAQVFESMDWEPSNDKILRSIRDAVDPREELMEWQDIISHEVKLQQSCKSRLYIVVDTNVLLQSMDNLQFLERLSKSTIKGFEMALIIPWQVLKELDNLKTKVDHKNVNKSARRAINFLSKVTNDKRFRVSFQTQAMHFEDCPQFVVEVPDDHLIKCCYQLKNRDQKVILLSNDINLRVKTSTINIPAVDDIWMQDILKQEAAKPRKKIHCFEVAPTDAVKSDACDYIHRITQVLVIFLSEVVAVKYKEKFGDLYPLWAPSGSCLEEMLNFIVSSTHFETCRAELSLIRSFYRRYTSYESIKAEDVEWIGRKCVTLVRSMVSFIPHDLALQFLKNLSFLKSEVGFATADLTYIDGSYRLAEKYFKDTESSLNEFVTYVNELYSGQGSQLKGNKDLLHHIDINLELITHFRDAILRFQEIQGEISLDSEAAKSLHNAMCNFLRIKKDEHTFPIFSPEDVAEYVNQNRTFFAPAVAWLNNQESTLKAIASALI